MSESETKERGTCVGCGATVSLEYDGEPGLRKGCKVSLSPKHEAVLCESDRGNYRSRGAVESCLRKAREKLLVCPGCGEKHRSVRMVGEICELCQARIESSRAREEQAAERDVGWYRLRLTDLVVRQRYSSEERPAGEAAREFVSCLAAALRWPGCDDESVFDHAIHDATPIPADGPDRSRDDPLVQLSAGQAEAVGRIVGLVKALLEAQYGVGHAEGASVLRQLVSGEATVGQFNEACLRAETVGKPRR
jgi:hypothetical protein